jgi:hypothetical protein
MFSLLNLRDIQSIFYSAERSLGCRDKTRTQESECLLFNAPIDVEITAAAAVNISCVQ